MMKRIIIIAIAALFSFGQGAWAQEEIEGLEYNEEGSYYEISSAADLNALATFVNEGDDIDWDKVAPFKMTKDITFKEGETFEPIGWGEELEGAPFSGIFDGQGFTIRGIKYYNKDAAGVGLFGYIHSPAYIHDVKLENCEFTGNFHVGAIAGYNVGIDDKSEWGIYNCTVGKGVKVTAVETTIEGVRCPGLFAGGIIGDCIGMTVKDCFSEAIVTGDDYLGCIAGRLMGVKDFGVIDNCYFSGNTYVQGSGDYNVAIGARGPLNGFEYYEEEGQEPSSEYKQGLIHITLLDDDREATIDNNKRIFNYEGETVNVTLEGRTLYKDNSWNTLCVPFNFDNTIFNGTSLASPIVMKLTGSEFKEESQALSLNFEQVDDIAAGYSYLVKWEVEKGKEEAIANPVFKNVIMGQQEQLDPREDGIGIITFKGMYTPQTIVCADKSILYMGADNKLYYPKTSMTINAFRAYFQLSEGYTCGDPAPATDPAPEEPNSINNFVLNFGDDMTGISLINHRSSVTSDSWFTLDGRKLSGQPTAKGIYINHGHTVIIK